MLTVIDCFSKFGWAILLKDKTGNKTKIAFEKIFENFKRIPEKVQSDKGKEFYNSDVKDLFNSKNIIHFSTFNKVTKACVVERFNRTLKEKMWKYFTLNNTNKYIDILEDLLKNYNNSKHRSIKMTPVEASKIENTELVFNNLYPWNKIIERPNPDFKVGDKVRIPIKWLTFKKGYTKNWDNIIYEISKVHFTNPYTYKLKGFQKFFYKEELNLVESVDDIQK